MKERQRHENNTISVEGLSLSECKKEIIYNKIKYGSHIKFKTTTTNSGGRKIYNKSIHLEKIKNRYILILAQKKECLKILPDLFVSSSVTNKTPSGTVVIMACVLDTKKFNQSSPWQSADFTKLKSTMLNNFRDNCIITKLVQFIETISTKVFHFPRQPHICF